MMSGRTAGYARKVEKGGNLADTLTEIANLPAVTLIATPVVGGR